MTAKTAPAERTPAPAVPAPAKPDLSPPAQPKRWIVRPEVGLTSVDAAEAQRLVDDGRAARRRPATWTSAASSLIASAAPRRLTHITPSSSERPRRER